MQHTLICESVAVGREWRGGATSDHRLFTFGPVWFGLWPRPNTWCIPITHSPTRLRTLEEPVPLVHHWPRRPPPSPSALLPRHRPLLPSHVPPIAPPALPSAAARAAAAGWHAYGSTSRRAALLRRRNCWVLSAQPLCSPLLWPRLHLQRLLLRAPPPTALLTSSRPSV